VAALADFGWKRVARVVWYVPRVMESGRVVEEVVEETRRIRRMRKWRKSTIERDKVESD